MILDAGRILIYLYIYDISLRLLAPGNSSALARCVPFISLRLHEVLSPWTELQCLPFLRGFSLDQITVSNL